MKVAFVNQPWSPAVPAVRGDSISIWTYEIARRLTGRCHVLFYGAKLKGTQAFRTSVQTVEGVQYRGISLAPDFRLLNRLFERSLKLLDKWGHRQRVPFFASRFWHLGYAVYLALDLRSQQCDVIHIHNFSQFVPILRFFNPGARIVLHMHCDWLSQLDAGVIESRLHQADLIVGCSEAITSKVQQCFPRLADRCRTVYNAVDLAGFSRPQNPCRLLHNRLLFVGRVSPEKGLHTLVDAFCQVADRYPALQLQIVGPEAMAPREFIVDLSDDPSVADLAQFYSGSYLAQLQERVPETLRGRVEFVGARDRPSLPDHYWQADLVLNPSLSEAFGMSLVEAMVAELPTIGTRVGGIPEVIQEGVTGLLVEPGNVSELAEAIATLLDDAPRRWAMGQAGRQRVLERFTWETVTDKLWNHYERLGKDYDPAIPQTSHPAGV